MILILQFSIYFSKTSMRFCGVQAVELDDLSPVDDLVKHSSSAVDIRTVLMQIKTFWAQLSWPDVESSYAFISKILDVSLKIFI